jgi:hypothetical protein
MKPRRSMSVAENTSSSESESETVVVPNQCDVVTGSSSTVGAPVVARRKWTDEADILLLKEVRYVLVARSMVKGYLLQS